MIWIMGAFSVVNPIKWSLDFYNADVVTRAGTFCCWFVESKDYPIRKITFTPQSACKINKRF